MTTPGGVAETLPTWPLRALAKLVVALIERCIQVNENQTVCYRLSALLAGVVESLAGRQSRTEPEDHAVRVFWSNTVPYIHAVIDQCGRSRNILGLYNARYRYKELDAAEGNLHDFVRDMAIVLPPLYVDLLAKHPKERDASPSFLEKAFRLEMTNAFVSVKDRLKSVGNARFTFFKPGHSSSGTAAVLKDVDLVFLCDATGGMANRYGLDGVKQTITQVADGTRQKVEETGGRVRLGLVAYRDLWVKRGLLEVEDLTFNTGRVKNHVGQLVPWGGMDVAEDVLGGLEAVTKLGWNPPASRKIVVHFADAPCHGSKFHDLGIEGDALFDMRRCNAQYGAGRTVEAALKDLSSLGMHYIFVRMNSTTDKMITTFRKLMKRGSFLTEVKMEDPFVKTKIIDAILSGPPADSSTTGQQPKTPPNQAPPPVPPRTLRTQQNQRMPEDPFVSPTTEAGSPSTRSKQFTPQHVRAVSEWKDIESEPERSYMTYNIIPNPEGAWESGKGAKTNLKVSKISAQGAQWQQSRALLCQAGGVGSGDRFRAIMKRPNHVSWTKGDYNGVWMAVNLAKKFNEVTSKFTASPKVEYAFASLLSEVGRRSDTFVLETFIAPPRHTPIETWATEGTFVAPGGEESLEAFVHFTDVHTRGKHMVVNLEGGKRISGTDKAYVLINPSVVSLLDDANPNGAKALQAFATSHTCNGICQEMELHTSSQGRVNSTRL